MKTEKLEAKLESFELVSPSPDFAKKIAQLLSMKKQQQRLISWNWGLAFFLVVSMGFNYWQLESTLFKNAILQKKVHVNQEEPTKDDRYISVEYGVSASGINQLNSIQVWRTDQ